MNYRLICVLLLLFCSPAVYSQIPKSEAPKTSADYLEVSRKNKTAGFVFLAVGGLISLYGATGDLSKQDLPFVWLGGSVFSLTSLPFFASAVKNEKRAKNANTSLEIRRSPDVSASSSVASSSASISFHLKF
ncbi:hypothetical protein [Rufibacter aurantiacus]|uniref:hypothetical protein n=1 Tax=Rufibacter aurantiacus TaxID=2817374 RepID=UPI001B30075E|nr:hypothetical protein [Rufibacter aurantiacus]